MRRLPGKWALLAALFVVLVLADQWTKLLAVERLTRVFERAPSLTLADRVRGLYTYHHLEALATEPYYVWKPVWRMNYVENPRAAFGIGEFLPPPWRLPFFAVVTLGAVALILHYYRKLEERQRFLQLALAFVLSGAIGNFIDRVAHGYVVDFVEWYWWNRIDLRWPTFNLADSLIVVGVVMLVLHPGQKRQEAGGRAGREKEAGAA